jgi:O-methyltransferase
MTPVRQQLRSGLRQARDFVIGQPELPVMTRLIRGDARAETFFAAVEFVNYERVAGDILEFGVFTGVSLALLAQGHSFDPKGMERRIAGFDSFDGLPPSAEEHARWVAGDCATNHGSHPLAAAGVRVTPQITRDLFAACGLPSPALHTGLFDRTVPAVVPSVYPAVAIAHIDCDLYESTCTALEAIEPALQEGTVLLFDDWFHYRGNPHKGEARAFREFLASHPHWEAAHYRSYATFRNAFILSRR